MGQRVLDPKTGEVRDLPAADAEAQFRAGQAHIPVDGEVPLADESGKVVLRAKSNEVSDALASGTMHFASEGELRKDRAEQSPGLAAAEGFANSVLIPGTYDFIAKAAGADMADVAARRETTAGQAAEYGGMAASFFIPGVDALAAQGAAGKFASRVLPTALAESAARETTKLAEKALAGSLQSDAARKAIAGAIGHAVAGAGVGAAAVLDEAALGNVEASTETLLSGIGAGGLIGGGLGGAIGALGARADGRLGKMGAEAARAAESEGQLTAGQLASALEAQGQEVDAKGIAKWFPAFMAKAASKTTGVAEEDVLKVMTPAGRKAVLAGDRARDEAVKYTSDLIDNLDANSAKFNLDEARLAPHVLNELPPGMGDRAIVEADDSLREARTGLRDMVRNAQEYGLTADQMTSRLRPLSEQLSKSEQNILRHIKEQESIVATHVAADPAAGGLSLIRNNLGSSTKILGETSALESIFRKLPKEIQERGLPVGLKDADVNTTEDLVQAIEQNRAHKQATIPGAWSPDKVEQVLGNRVAQTMIRGKASPVAELALSRLAKPALDTAALRTQVDDAISSLSKEAKKHTNRGAKWTGPSIESVVEPEYSGLEAKWGNDWAHLKLGESQLLPAKVALGTAEAPSAEVSGWVEDRQRKMYQLLSDPATRPPMVDADGTVTLYRGANNLEGGGSLPVRELSSWSDSPTKAGGYGEHLYQAKVPIEDIWAWHGHNNAFSSGNKRLEREWVVLNGQGEIPVTRVNPEDVEGLTKARLSQLKATGKMEPAPAPSPSKLSRFADSSRPVSDQNVKEIYRELDRVHRILDGQGKKIKPILGESRTIGDVAKGIRDRLQDESTWGGAARIHKELSDAVEREAGARATLGDHFPSRAGKVDRGSVLAFTKSMDRVTGEPRMQALADWIDSQNHLADTARANMDVSFSHRGQRLVKEYGDVFKRMKEDVLSLNAQDRLLKSNRAQGVIPGMALGTGLASLGLGPVGYAAGNAIGNTILNPGRSARQLAAILEYKKQIAGHITERIGKIVTGSGVARKLPIQAPKWIGAMIDGSPKERQDAFESHRKELEDISDPVSYINHISPQLTPIAAAAPDHANQIAIQGQKTLAYLANEMPKPVSSLGPQAPFNFINPPKPKSGSPFDVKPRQAARALPEDIRRYGQVAAIAVGGTPALLDAIERGNLNAAQVRAFKSLFPHQDADVQQQLVTELGRGGNKVSPKVQKSLMVYLSAGAQDSAVTQFQQGIYAENIAEESGGGAAANLSTPNPRAPVMIGPLSTPTDATANFPFPTQ